MKNKKVLTVFCLALFLVLANPSYADIFFDDFNDGDFDGWIISSPWNGGGNWLVEEGKLKEDGIGDGQMLIVDQLTLTDQSVEVEMYPLECAGYSGIVVWYKDRDNYVYISAYSSSNPLGLWVSERENGVSRTVRYPYIMIRRTWHTMRVDADSQTGEISVYMDDNFVINHQTTIADRSGFTGVMSGNSGAYFDDFQITSADIGPKYPTNKEECKKDKWKEWTDLSFKNQGECISYVESNENAGKRD